MDFESLSQSGVPGFEIETHDDAFWVSVAFRTQAHLKTSTELSRDAFRML